MHNKPYLKVLLASLCLLLPFSSIAQRPDQYNRIVKEIDSLANLGLPKSALIEIDRLENLARKNRNPAQHVKAVIYRMNFQSYLEENALEAVINRLRLDADTSDYPVKQILQSLLAEMYWNYYRYNRYQFSKRSALSKPDQDFTRWDLKALANEATALYGLSLKNSELAQKTPVDILEGVLLGEPKTRYLRPTLYDLLAHRALDFFLSEEPGLPDPKAPFTLKAADFFDDNQEFLNTPVRTADTLSLNYQGIKLLQDITRFHLERKNSEALADVNLKRLAYVFGKSVHPEKDSLYLQGLNKLVDAFSESQIAADALVRIGQYYKQKDSLKIAKSYFDRALRSFPESIGGQNAINLIRQIEQKEISVVVEHVNLPAKPLLAQLNYRNLNEVKYKLYKLTDKQLKDLATLNDKSNRRRNTNITPSDALLKYLNELKVFNEENIRVINLGDYKRHTTEFKLDPLEAGSYLLLTRYAATDNKELTNIASSRSVN